MQDIVSVSKLQTGFGSQIIHDGLEMHIQAGEVFGIVGGSGSGKTVLLNTLLGIMHPRKGSITVLGYPVTSQGVAPQIKHKLGVLFQHGALFSSLTVLQNICVPLLEQSDVTPSMAKEMAYVKMQMVGLDLSAAHKLPEALSGGMVKRAALARALAMDARLLSLDEPTSGLDPLSADAFDDLVVQLKETLGLTVVMITHDLGTLSLCDNIGVIIEKKMITGSVAEVAAYPHPWVQDYFHGRRAHAFFGGL